MRCGACPASRERQRRIWSVETEPRREPCRCGLQTAAARSLRLQRDDWCAAGRPAAFECARRARCRVGALGATCAGRFARRVPSRLGACAGRGCYRTVVDRASALAVIIFCLMLFEKPLLAMNLYPGPVFVITRLRSCPAPGEAQLAHGGHGRRGAAQCAGSTPVDGGRTMPMRDGDWNSRRAGPRTKTSTGCLLRAHNSSRGAAGGEGAVRGCLYVHAPAFHCVMRMSAARETSLRVRAVHPTQKLNLRRIDDTRLETAGSTSSGSYAQALTAT